VAGRRRFADDNILFPPYRVVHGNEQVFMDGLIAVSL
jgi:hypothetical protein